MYVRCIMKQAHRTNNILCILIKSEIVRAINSLMEGDDEHLAHKSHLLSWKSRGLWTGFPPRCQALKETPGKGRAYKELAIYVCSC